MHPLFLALVVIRRDLQRLIASVADRSLCQMLNTLVASLPRSLLPLHSRVTKWFVVTRSIEGLTQTVHWQTSVSRNLISGLVIFGCGFEGSFSSSEAEKGPRLIWQRPSFAHSSSSFSFESNCASLARAPSVRPSESPMSERPCARVRLISDGVSALATWLPKRCCLGMHDIHILYS